MMRRSIGFWVLLVCLFGLCFSAAADGTNPYAAFLSGESIHEVRGIQYDSDGTPIIFVPGVMGSKLYMPESGRLVWYSLFAAMFYPEQLNISCNLEVRNNLVNQEDVFFVQREYGSNGMYVSLINRLCREFSDRPVYFFSYDFRRPCDVSAESLAEEIEAVKRLTGHATVDIVCHSMGGVVVSEYVSRFGDAALDKVVVLGTPFEGAPDALYSAYTGSLFGLPEGLITPTTGLSADIISKYPGITDMYPTDAYAAGGGICINGAPADAEGYGEFVSALCDGYRERPAANEVLAGMPNTYFAAGNTKKTTVGISFLEDGETRLVVSREGDGTVPYASATMFGKLTMLLPDENGVSRFREFAVAHNDLLGDEVALEWICDVLR
ncbi:MAG: hypothetical protein Q4Q04_00195 [Methanocorpusculum sp.]|nr:hypothetical protein [Methanocorpusculum sp.]